MLRTVQYGVVHLLLLVLLLQSGCQLVVQPEAAPVAMEEVAEESEEHAEAHVVHWAYTGEEGPEHWGMISEDFGVCATGHEQSPIDLVAAHGENLPDIIFNYQPSSLNIFNNGHTLQVNYDPGSTIEVDGVTYELKQFHFHSQSEHTVDGVYYPLELHFVHSTPEGNLAVVGVLIEPGEENAAFADVWANAPSEASEVTLIEGATVNALDMMPTAGSYFGYPGSLTTPPCSEGVKWHVLTTPIQMSQAQLDAISAILNGNYRPVQELYERELDVDNESVAIK